MDDIVPRPPSIDPSVPTVAGRLRLCLESDGKWWELFDDMASRDELEQELTSSGIFLSPKHRRDFLENNAMSRIVGELRSNCRGKSLFVPPWIETGFSRLRDVVVGIDDRTRSAMTLLLKLTPLCATSPSNLKSVLSEPTDMAVLCGHNDDTRMAWAWFKSLLCTLLAFFWPDRKSVV